MTTPPKWLMDAGTVTIALFFFTASIFYVYKIVMAVRAKSNENGNGNGKRQPCVQSPQLQAIMTNQMMTMKAVQKMETAGEDLGRNMALQTKLMEQFGRILEKLSDCMIRQEAQDDVRQK